MMTATQQEKHLEANDYFVLCSAAFQLPPEFINRVTIILNGYCRTSCPQNCSSVAEFV
jgi:hypothetical protein